MSIATIIRLILDWLARLFTSGADDVRTLPWGARVSQTFRDRAAWVADALEVKVEWLMAVMAFESAETFTASVQNPISRATGLIQFMPRTAAGMDTSVEELSQMTAEDQLNYVYRYLLPYKGRMKTMSDLYMAVLWPAAVGKPYDFVLFASATHPAAYAQNRGLDVDQDGRITKTEATAYVQRAFEKGMRAENVWIGPVTTELT